MEIDNTSYLLPDPTNNVSLETKTISENPSLVLAETNGE